MWVVVAVVLFSARSLAAQGPDAVLSQAVVSYQNLDYAASSDLLRRTLARPGLTSDQQEQALSYLGASEFFLGHHDAAVAAFRQMVTLDPRGRLDALTFPPEVQRIYDEARRSTKSVSVDVPPGESELVFGRSSLPIRLFASSYQDVAVGIMSESGKALYWIYQGPVADSVDLAWDGKDASHNPLASGSYTLRVATRSPAGRVIRSLDIPLKVSLQISDTLALPRPPGPSQFLPERTRFPLIRSAAIGLALGALTVALPAAVDAPTPKMEAPILVGSAIGISGLVAFALHPKGEPIEKNIAYNQRLKDEWQRRVDEIKQNNGARRSDVRLLVRTGQPVVREGSDQ